MPASDLSMGLDAGGTSTDAVVLDARGRVVAKAKAPRGPDLRTGLATAVAELAGSRLVNLRHVTRATLGATHTVDAALARRGTTRVAVLRIGGPFTHAIPPLTTWPDELRAGVSAGTAVVRGGADYDGRRSATLDEPAIARFMETVGPYADAVAITGVFSPIAPDDELAAAEIVRSELGIWMHVSLSHEIGSLGLLERENATVLNAALVDSAGRLTSAFGEVLAEAGVDAEPFFAQNDGTVMSLEHALRFPVLMLCTGPANAMRGAAHLSGVEEGVVVDVGGTTATLGVLVHGLPRESAQTMELAGVRMELRRPDVRRLAFGGGGAGAPEDVVRLLDEAIDRSGAAIAPVPLVAVGGAGGMVPEGLAAVSEVLRPDDGDVAGAIGAAVAPASGQAYRVCENRPDRRRAALAATRTAACDRAVHAGADPGRVEVIEVEEVPLTYLVDPLIRIRVKAAGPRA